MARETSSEIFFALMSGRTPSCTATMAPSGTQERAFFTEWKRVKPPWTSRWGQLNPAPVQYSFQ